MKSASFIAFLLIIFFDSYGQGPPEFGLFAGPQATSALYFVNNVKQETDYKYGFQAGASFKVPFDNQLYFSPAIYYSKKGYEVQLKDKAYPPSTLAKNNSTTIHTIEIGGFLQFDFSKQPATFFIKAGPAFDYAFSGTEKFDLVDGTAADQNMKFSYADYGHYSASMIGAFGYETASRFMIFIQYSHGLGNINNNDGGPRITHRVLGLSIGKYFNNKKIKAATK
ncbi:MAG TPA: porin family protein [Chitinophagaceae bacterium]